MKVRNRITRPIKIGDVSINPGEEAIVGDTPTTLNMLNKGIISVLDSRITESSPTREELLSMKMSELREIGDPIGAKDTSKEELVDEIIKKRR